MNTFLPAPTTLSSDLHQAGWRGDWFAFWAMVKKELIVITRYPVSFVTSFAQVFLIVVIFSLAASMFEPQGVADYGGDSGVGTYGIILFLFFSDALWSIGGAIRQEQVQGTLEQLYLSPASKFASLVSRVANILAWTSLLSIMAALAMTAVNGRAPFVNPLLGLYVLVFSLLGTFGVGFAFAALTLYVKQTAETIINLTQFAFLIVCANFFPFSALPEQVLVVSRLIPLSYSVDAFRSTLMGYPPGFPELAPIEVEIIIVTVFGLAMPLLGYWLYRRAEEHARQVGGLGEF